MIEHLHVSQKFTGSHPEIAVIKLDGYIDHLTAIELDKVLGTLFNNGQFNVIMDLSGAEYVSSAGWGIFLAEIKQIRENGGDLKLSAMVPNVREIFELLEFNYILQEYDTIEAAVEDFRKVMLTPGG